MREVEDVPIQPWRLQSEALTHLFQSSGPNTLAIRKIKVIYFKSNNSSVSSGVHLGEDVLEPGQEMIVACGFSNRTLSVHVTRNSRAVIDHLKSD